MLGEGVACPCPAELHHFFYITHDAEPGMHCLHSEDELTRRDGVVLKLRTRLPSKSAAQLAHLDSDSIINLYNHHVLSNRG